MNLKTFVLHLLFKPVQYYELLATMQMQGRTIDSMTSNELLVIDSLASDSLEVTAFAKALLDWKEIKIWDHNIEEETVRGSKSSGTQLEIKNESRLYNAAPNPTNTETVIHVMIDKADLSGNPVLAINDLSGRLHATYNLKQGDNFVDINISALNAGIYFYSLKIGGNTKEVKKLSIIH